MEYGFRSTPRRSRKYEGVRLNRFLFYRSTVRVFEVRIFIFMILAFLMVCGLQSRQGYAESLPSSIVSMPGIGSRAILVEKSSQTLSLYRLDNELVLDRKINCSTGKMPGRKQESGDQKTPEGVYFFVGKYLEKDLAPVYGVMALPMDYPNMLDHARGRNGNSIWMHGTDKELKPMDSNGCVALENHELERVEKEISLDFTPIIITDKIEFSDSDDNIRITEAIDSLLTTWKDSLSQGDYHDYLSFYASEYFPRMDWWNDWRSIRTTSSEDAGPFSFEINNRGIYRDGDVFVVIFKLKLKRGDHEQDVGIRKLYVAQKAGVYKIFGDTHKVIHAAGGALARDEKKRSPLFWATNQILAAEQKDRENSVGKAVKQTIDTWLKSWIKGDIDQYGLCYSAGFSAGDMDKHAWLERKKYLSTVYDYIDISISEPVLKIDGYQVRADFRQYYKSSGYSAEGIKTLVLVNEEGKWKILQEIWKKS